MYTNSPIDNLKNDILSIGTANGVSRYRPLETSFRIHAVNWNFELLFY
jgi:hypothetical protein